MEPLTDNIGKTIKYILEKSHGKNEHAKGIQQITVVHILYNSFPVKFAETAAPEDFVCWPMLADKLSMSYMEDKTVKLKHIIFNIDKRFRTASPQINAAIEKHLASMYVMYPRVDFHYNTLSGMFFNPATIINQVKLLTASLPSNLLFNFVYYGNTVDLLYNPFQLLMHNPRIFAPPYENSINAKHMLVDVKVTAEFGVAELKWKPGDDWRFYELKEFRIPALFELIQLHDRKCYCPVTKNPLNIYEMFELPLTRPSSGIPAKSIAVIKTYMNMMFIGNKLQSYIDTLIDEITSLCLSDILRIYILQLGGSSGSECFQMPICVVAVALLHAIKQYLMLPPGRAQIYVNVIKAIVSQNTYELTQACTEIVESL